MPAELAPRAAYHRNKISRQIDAIDLLAMWPGGDAPGPGMSMNDYLPKSR